MKFKSVFLLVTFVATCSSLSYAQNSCKQPNKDENIATLIFSKAEQTQALGNFLQKYCYSPDSFHPLGMEIPSFYSSTLEQLKIFMDRDPILLSRKNKWNQDMLSQVMIDNFLLRPLEADELAVLRQDLSKYGYKETPYVGISESSRRQILDYILPSINLNSIKDRDLFGMNSLAYSVITVEPKVFAKINPTTASLFMQLNWGVTPVHLFFAPHYRENLSPADLSQLNDLLLKKAPPSTLGALGAYRPKSLTYYDFAEIMKEYNPDLYDKIKSSKGFKVSEKYKNPEEAKKMKEELLKDVDFKIIFASKKDIIDGK